MRAASSTLILAFYLASMAAVAADKVDGFSQLPKTDTLQVQYTSSGCFHSSAYEFTFQRGATPSVSIVQTEGISLGDLKPASGKGKGKPEQLQLTAADLKGLDGLLRFYRSKPDGGCTTVDHITISQVHEGKVVATENFVDGSCSTYGTNDFVTLPQIVWRLKEKK